MELILGDNTTSYLDSSNQMFLTNLSVKFMVGPELSEETLFSYPVSWSWILEFRGSCLPRNACLAWHSHHHSQQETREPGLHLHEAAYLLKPC